MTYWVSLSPYRNRTSSSQVWGQCSHNHYAECLCDISSFVLMLYMVWRCDLIWYESSSKDDLLSSDFPLSLPACCCSLFVDKIFFCQGATDGCDKLDKKGDIYLLQLLLEGQLREFRFREMRMEGVSWWYSLWVGEW